MYHNFNLDYENLVKNNIEFFRYATKSCDNFSVITNQKKPYSQRPPLCEHDEILKRINASLQKYIVGIGEWPGTKAKMNHKVIFFYKCCKETREFLINQNNFFLPQYYKLPEDICFYREKKVWLTTISHEKLAFIQSATKEDIVFLNLYSILKR